VTRQENQRRPAQRRAFRAAVTTALTATLPSLHEDDVDGVLEKARAAKGIPLRELAEHLADHPDALSSGNPSCPAVVIRLAHTLHDAGHTTVVRPGCASCGKVSTELTRMGPNGRVCQMCSVRSSLGTCARCRRANARIAARREEGGICYPCYRVDSEVVEECGRCRRVRMPVTRLDDGTPICHGCWNPPIHRCDLCGQERPAGISGTEGTICRDCYRHHRQPHRRCGRCGRVRPISKRAVGDAPDLCHSCNLGPEMICASCGRRRPARRRGADAAWLCHTCRSKTIDNCCRCGQDKTCPRPLAHRPALPDLLQQDPRHPYGMPPLPRDPRSRRPRR
jgi:hypothetical protein